jgi:hypothetical protein
LRVRAPSESSFVQSGNLVVCVRVRPQGQNTDLFGNLIVCVCV